MSRDNSRTVLERKSKGRGGSMYAMRYALLATCVMVVGIAVAGDEPGPVEFKSPAARLATETYNGEIQKLTRDYQQKADVARKACIAQLTSAQQSATKAGNLDEAVRIRDAITRLNSDAPEPAGHTSPKGVTAAGLLGDRQKLSQALAGSVWESGDTKFRFNDDGTGIYLTGGKPPWTWIAMSGKEAYVRYGSGWTNRLEFDEAAKSFTFIECGIGKTIAAQSGKRVQ